MSSEAPFRPLFASEAWFERWLRAFGEGRGGVWQPGSQPEIGVPYVLTERRIGPLRIKEARAAANSHTPRYDVLGHPADVPELLREMMRSLDVALLTFPYLPRDSTLLGGLDADTEAQLTTQIDFCERAPFVDCTMGWDAYWESRGKSRREWGRRERRLTDEGAEFSCLTEWPEIEGRFREIVDIEASGWKGREGSAIVQDPATLEFYTENARAWAEQGWLRLFLLTLGGRPIAFELDAECEGVMNCIKHGYLEELSKKGPGQVLRIHVLRWCFEQPGVRLFDMFGPEAKAKLKWATGGEDLFTLRVFHRSPAGLLAWTRLVAAPRIKAHLSRQPESA